MHYFQFNIKSYRAATAHLTNEEDLVYRRLIEYYYDKEAPIPDDKPLITRCLRVALPDLENVLKEFFTLTEKGWQNEYCDTVIREFKAFTERQRLNGSKGGRGHKANAKPKKPNGKPDKPTAKPTINNKQETNINRNIKKLIPEDFKISEQVRVWAKSKNIRNIDDHLEPFVEMCKANGYKKLDFDSFFKNAVRNDWAKLGHGSNDGFQLAQ